MQEMGWTYEDLMDTPYEVYLDTTRILSLESKEEEKEQKKVEARQKQGQLT